MVWCVLVSPNSSISFAYVEVAATLSNEPAARDLAREINERAAASGCPTRAWVKQVKGVTGLLKRIDRYAEKQRAVAKRIEENRK